MVVATPLPRPHRKYVPRLVDVVRDGKVDPLKVLTKREPLTDVIDAHKVFDKRWLRWVKVELKSVA